MKSEILKRKVQVTLTISIFVMGTGMLKAQTGINTYNPTEALDVADGNLRVREINDNDGDIATDKLVVANTDGVLKTVNAAMPKFFYMPSIVFDVSSTATDQTKELHALYLDQFTGSDLVGSAGAPEDIPNLPDANDLYYYVTYYDDAVFENVTIDADGTLHYDVISTTPNAASFMNIVFVVQD